MKDIIVLNDKKYKIIDNYGNCIKIEEIESFLTSYFDIYDYICGDYAYDRLRLKGFCDKENKNHNKKNDIKGYEKNISDLCSYKCKHFLMSIVNENGETEEVEVILAFEFKDNKKEYVVYTKNETDENGNVTVYVSNVDRSSGEPKLLGIDNESEWDRIKDVLRELSKPEAE